MDGGEVLLTLGVFSGFDSLGFFFSVGIYFRFGILGVCIGNADVFGLYDGFLCVSVFCLEFEFWGFGKFFGKF